MLLQIIRYCFVILLHLLDLQRELLELFEIRIELERVELFRHSDGLVLSRLRYVCRCPSALSIAYAFWFGLITRSQSVQCVCGSLSLVPWQMHGRVVLLLLSLLLLHDGLHPLLLLPEIFLLKPEHIDRFDCEVK